MGIILESGLPVYGFGAKKTPQPFVDACSPFIYIENLIFEQEEKSDNPQPSAVKKKSKASLRRDAGLINLLRTAVEQSC